MKNFRDQVVVITGAGSGIGRATALAFARRGAKLHLADISRERIESAAAEIRALGAEATPYVVDVSDREAVKNFADQVFAAAGRVDVLHNNAGIGVGALLEETTLEDWENVVAVNLWGVIYGVHYFLPRMIAQGGGHIVNTASGAGLCGLPTLAPYTTTKFAVVGLCETMNLELQRHKIYTTALCPGIIATNITKDSKVVLKDAEGKLIKDTVHEFYQKWGTPPERVAEDVLKAVSRRRPVMPTPLHMWPLWILKRISVRLYQAILRAASRPMFPR